MTQIWERAIRCAQEIEQRFRNTGELVEVHKDERLGIYDLVFHSLAYRRAHISIIDARESRKIWMLHVTVFPHYNDNSPIYGFDIVAGQDKVSGAFHDFSSGGDSNHDMMRWFANLVAGIDWNKRRELPDWARTIFSKHIVAIGSVGLNELDEFIDLGLRSLSYYLANVGHTQQDVSNYAMTQNSYCFHQKKNPHTPRVLVNLGFTEQEAKDFVNNNLFPEIEVPS
jgi:phycocyanobilin:ferredoxin oxidoreductase